MATMVTHRFTLSIVPGGVPPTIHLSQYDDARTFVAQLRDENGAAFSPGNSATATLEGVNRKGVTFKINATVSGSEITFTPKEAATDQDGKILATLHIKNGSSNISPLAIKLDVRRAGATKEDVARDPGFTDEIDSAVEAYLIANPIGIVGTLQADGTLYVEDMNLVADFDSEVF